MHTHWMPIRQIWSSASFNVTLSDYRRLESRSRRVLGFHSLSQASDLLSFLSNVLQQVQFTVGTIIQIMRNAQARLVWETYVHASACSPPLVVHLVSLIVY
jgi:hypothetical protein